MVYDAVQAGKYRRFEGACCLLIHSSTAYGVISHKISHLKRYSKLELVSSGSPCKTACCQPGGKAWQCTAQSDWLTLSWWHNAEDAKHLPASSFQEQRQVYVFWFQGFATPCVVAVTITRFYAETLAVLRHRKPEYLRDLRFSQPCCWIVKLSGTLRRVSRPLANNYPCFERS